MKKNNLIFYLFVFCSWILVSCSEDVEQMDTANSRSLTMELSAGEDTEAGDDALNENKIGNVSVFFFTDENASCTYLKRNLSMGSDNTINIEINNSAVEGKLCTVYIVANYTSNKTNEELQQMTLAQIKSLVISTTFQTDDKAESSFVMQGQTETPIEVISGGNGGTIHLKRVASKIVLVPKVANEVVSGGITYKPDLAKMEVDLVNVANVATLEGGALPEGEKQKFTNAHRTYKSTPEGSEEAYAHIPLYSYPNKWADVEGATETYLHFRIPWYYIKEGTQLSTNYYYRVAIGSGKLESNKLYRITADIQVLGSIDPEDTHEVEATYEISDWKRVDIPADINRYKYLELETNFVEMKNESRVDVGFSSSTEATAKLVEVRFWDYSVTDYYENVVTNEEPPKPSGNAPTPPNKNDYNILGVPFTWWLNPKYWEANSKYEEDLKTYNEAKNKYDTWLKYFGNKEYLINIYGQTLTFEHPLEADTRVPYTYIIEVTNKDGLTEQLTIVQYPPIYIEGESNQANGGQNRFVYGQISEGNVNDDNRNSIGSVAHYEDGSNHNPNQYTIYVTVLDETSNYVIGDPRQTTATSLSGLNNKQGGLKSYHPTKDGDEVRDMISPAFKIASSWGQTTSTNYTQLQKRCAAYQENGYPAGRWRIPTEAEIKFVIDLSDKGYIPELFDGDYYASSGRYYQSGRGFSNNPDKNGEHAVRCIYDVWYWSNDKIADPYTFTWGDEPRN